MSDRRRARSEQVNSIVSSAAIITRKAKALMRPESWQEELWQFYDTTPELRFALSYLSNGMSRVRLVAARLQPGGDEPTPITEDDPQFECCTTLLADLANGASGQSQLMADLGTQLSLPGVGFLVGVPSDFNATRNEWQVLSVDEIEIKNGMYRQKVGPTEWKDLGPVPNPNTPVGTPEAAEPEFVIVQVWTGHRRFHFMPDSQMRACLPILRELNLLTQYIEATATSRLAGAGILVLPKEIDFNVKEENEDAEDPFMAELMDAMLTPIGDPESAARVVPLIIRVGAQYIEHIKHLTLDTSFDKEAINLRKEAISRFATGCDMPAEVLLGLGDTNHWSAWQIDQSTVRMHIAPKSETICQGVTIGYFQPALQAAGVDDPSLVVWYDLSELDFVPDKAGNATNLFDRQLIGAQATRRESAFDESDAPTDDEISTAVILQTIQKLPQYLPVLGKYVGINLPGLPQEPLVIARESITEAITPGQAPVEPIAEQKVPGSKPAGSPGPPPGPAVAPAETQPGAVAASAAAARSDALMAVCDVLVFRALERAGNKLANKAKAQHPEVLGTSPVLVHTCLPDATSLAPLDSLLAGAWDHVEALVTRLDVDPVSVTQMLDTYARSLIAAGTPHSFDLMVQAFGGE